jgi:Dyp-type peroxidase family
MPSTPIQINDPLLDNLQANILKGHGRNFAHHLFFQFDVEKVNLAKDWISQFASSPGGITSAEQQLETTADFKAGKRTDGGTIFTLSLTSKGYDILGLNASKPNSGSFFNGMEGSADLLKDDKSNWEEAFKADIHMLLIVADADSTIAKNNANGIVNEISSFATLLLNQRGNVLKVKGGTGIEHFGYADGISQPLFLADDINGQGATTEWNDETDRNLLLVQDSGTDQPDSFGSFLVFRKLEQNVKAFKDAEGDDGPAGAKVPVIKDVDGNNNKDLGGAWNIGRFENGTPVAKSSVALQTNLTNPTNDFNYADDLQAIKCPFPGHTRLMNPRDGDTIAGDVSAQRITRRGIPFDDVQRIPEAEITNISDELLDKNQPTGGVGLLFMSYQSSIETQFEIIKGHWANEGNIRGHLIGAQDSLIGQGTNPDKTLPQQWGQPSQTSPFSFHGFVTMKGGEYFFTPSISFLKSVGNTQAAV